MASSSGALALPPPVRRRLPSPQPDLGAGGSDLGASGAVGCRRVPLSPAALRLTGLRGDAAGFCLGRDPLGSMFAATPRSRASVGLSSVASRSMARPASAPDPGEVISLAAAAAAMASTTADSGTGDWPMSAAAPGELSAARAMALRGAEASGLFPLAAGLGAGTAGGLDLPALEDLLATDFFAAAAGLEPAAGGLGLARFAGGGEVNLLGFEIFLFARPSLTPLTAGGGVAAGATADMVRTSRCQGTTRTVYRAGRVRHARSLVPYPVPSGFNF